jgi:ABC-type phosphate transport system permease subunit
LTLTLAIVLVFTEAVLLARGRFAGALVLAVIALPVLVFAARRQRNS